MPKIITNKAQMQCTLGAAPQPLTVTSQPFVKDNGELVATEGDNQGMVNVPPFGACKRVWYNPPCSPTLAQWSETSKLGSIVGKKKLTTSSKCKCQFGGEISFMDTGKNEHVKCE